MGSPWRIDPMTYRTTSERSYHRATSRSSQLGVIGSTRIPTINEGNKDMFYLTTPWTHLRAHSIGHVLKRHTDLFGLKTVKVMHYVVVANSIMC